MGRSMRRLAVMVSLLIIMVLTGPVIAVAQDVADNATPAAADQIRFALNPKGEPDGSFFELEVDAGSSSELTVAISNQSIAPLTLRSFVSDVYTIVNGGFGVSDEGHAIQPPTPWIDYPAETYALEPGEGIEITFKVDVPKDAAPGNYVSALVVQTAEPIPVEGTALFNQIIRKAIAIDLTVSGQIDPAFSIGEIAYDVTQSSQTLNIAIANTGNARVRPTGTLVVRDGMGTEVITATIAMGSVFTGTATLLQLVLQRPLDPGLYTLSLDLRDDTTGATAALTDAPFTATEAPEPAPPAPVSFADLALTPLPDASSPQFVAITGTIVNDGSPVSNARLTLVVRKNNTEVERFVLYPSLSLPAGSTPIEQRYLPMTGFTSGSWSFTLVLESVDTASGVATLLLQEELPQPLVIR